MRQKMKQAVKAAQTIVVDGRLPLIVYGDGGMGKTSIISRVLLNIAKEAAALEVRYIAGKR